MTKRLMLQSENWQRLINAANRAATKCKSSGQYERPYETFLAGLFWKYISDLWRENVESVENIPNAGERNFKLAQSRFILPEGASFYDVVSRCRYPGLDSLVRKSLRSISQANAPKLASTFEQTELSNKQRLSPRSENSLDLTGLLSELNTTALDLRPSKLVDIDIGEVFLHLISRYYSSFGKKTNRYYTHDDIALLMAKLASPSEGNTVCDPFCGTGSLLLRVAQELGKGECWLFGQERDTSVQAIARMNLMINEIDDALIFVGDSLLTSAFGEDILTRNFDRVVADPPLSKLDIGMAANIDSGSPPKDYEEQWKRLQVSSPGHRSCIEMLLNLTKPKAGKLVVTVPAEILSQGELDRLFRRDLISDNLLDTVISIPSSKMFNEQDAAILVIDRSREHGGRHAGKSGVAFIDGKKCFEPVVTANDAEYGHIDSITSAYLNREIATGFSAIATTSMIAKNNFDLVVSRYI